MHVAASASTVRPSQSTTSTSPTTATPSNAASTAAEVIRFACRSSQRSPSDTSGCRAAARRRNPTIPRIRNPMRAATPKNTSTGITVGHCQRSRCGASADLCAWCRLGARVLDALGPPRHRPTTARETPMERCESRRAVGCGAAVMRAGSPCFNTVSIPRDQRRRPEPAAEMKISMPRSYSVARSEEVSAPRSSAR